MSDEMVIRCCAPTLAAIKTGSLFNCAFASRGEMTASLRAINNCLLCKGVRAIPLRYRDGRALVYLFRPDMLERDLRDPVAAGILKETGYPDENISCRISWLIRRLEESDTFPHEIGLFLGYPPEDVSGFIAHRACDYKCAGCWKVYGDVKKCRQLFAKYKQCTRIYESCLHHGADVVSMTVSERNASA